MGFSTSGNMTSALALHVSPKAPATSHIPEIKMRTRALQHCYHCSQQSSEYLLPQTICSANAAAGHKHSSKSRGPLLQRTSNFHRHPIATFLNKTKLPQQRNQLGTCAAGTSISMCTSSISFINILYACCAGSLVET